MKLEQPGHQVARGVLVEIRRQVTDAKRPFGVEPRRGNRRGRRSPQVFDEIDGRALGGGLEVERRGARNRKKREWRNGLNRLPEGLEQARSLSVEIRPVDRVQQLMDDVGRELDAVRLDLGGTLEVADGVAVQAQPQAKHAQVAVHAAVLRPDEQERLVNLERLLQAVEDRKSVV